MKFIFFWRNQQDFYSRVSNNYHGATECLGARKKFRSSWMPIDESLPLEEVKLFLLGDARGEFVLVSVQLYDFLTSSANSSTFKEWKESTRAESY